jgi:hypothetical protein
MHDSVMSLSRAFTAIGVEEQEGVKAMRCEHAVRFGLIAIGCLSLVGIAHSQNANTVTPSQVLADQLRSQRYPCDRMLSSKQDVEASKRDESVWLVKCTNGNYRMRLVPDMAAKVERID